MTDPDKETILSAAEWLSRREQHRAEILPWTESFRARRGRGELHPVYDFLFTYYRFSSRKLEQWHPGYGSTLSSAGDAAEEEFLLRPGYERCASGVRLSSRALDEGLINQLTWIASLCRAVEDRPARFSCLGLHEWAMVYRSPQIRHAYPLRLKAAEADEFLESETVCCSHFDAFRFFTPSAVSLNILQPTSDSRLELEQGGCIHANMDLYKWAFKLAPLIPGELLRSCFQLALKAREVDMRASPYDLALLGFVPIQIETTSGQEEYRRMQKEIYDAAVPLRRELRKAAEAILSTVSEQPGALSPSGQHEASL